MHSHCIHHYVHSFEKKWQKVLKKWGKKKSFLKLSWRNVDWKLTSYCSHKKKSWKKVFWEMYELTLQSKLAIHLLSFMFSNKFSRIICFVCRFPAWKHHMPPVKFVKKLLHNTYVLYILNHEMTRHTNAV